MQSVCLVRRQWVVHEDAALATRLQENECEFTESIVCALLYIFSPTFQYQAATN